MKKKPAVKKPIKREDGGPVEAGRKYLVGEKGPEKYEQLKPYKFPDYKPIRKYLSPVEVIRGTKKSTQAVETDNPPGRKKGGPVKKGKKYVVGEKGPEIFVPKKSGKIIPNKGSKPKPKAKKKK